MDAKNKHYFTDEEIRKWSENRCWYKNPPINVLEPGSKEYEALEGVVGAAERAAVLMNSGGHNASGIR